MRITKKKPDAYGSDRVHMGPWTTKSNSKCKLAGNEPLEFIEEGKKPPIRKDTQSEKKYHGKPGSHGWSRSSKKDW